MTPSKRGLQSDEILALLRKVAAREEKQARLGLGQDRWDFGRLAGLLDGSEGTLDQHALSVLGTYAEFLDSRSSARELVAERLLTFEETTDDFFGDKSFRVSAQEGFQISSDGKNLSESQLSSGEYQLLFLMVSALTTKRRGTIIAIDEPELSMHIAWQRMLVPSLIRCASRAAPQLILATHSPDIAAGYPQSMIELTGMVK
jgi:predicted ATPase